MIQIYGKENTAFDKNGDCVLMPSVSDVSAELNGTWSVTLEHPVDEEGRWKYIEEGCVVKMPSFNGEQLFRIKSVTKNESRITAAAEPVFMDAADDCFLVDVRPTGKTGQEALDIMTAPNGKYHGKSDIQTVSTAYYEFKNLIEAINGEDDNSFLRRWGGEILFDNYTIIINKRVGDDYGASVCYGKNIPVDGMSEETDLSGVVTRIYPKGYNGVTMTGNGCVDSPLINSYPTVKTKVISFEDVKMAADAQEDDAANGITVCGTQDELDAALKAKCSEQFTAGLDKPAVTISVDMVLLSDTEQYRDYQTLENVSLGDTVRCVNSKLGIDTSARVVSLVYDAILKKVKSVVIGELSYNYFSDVSSSVSRIEGRVDGVIRDDGTVMGEKIQGFIDGARAQLRTQSSVSKKQDVRAILFEDLDPASPTFGAMCLGTKGFEIAGERTADGRDWNWSTFGTGKGFNADLITAGTMVGEHIYGGTISVGGSGNANGKISVLSDSNAVVVNMDRNGITLSDGASLISSSGVCGNLQFVSYGGEFHALGGNTNWSRMVIFFTANIPDNYVITNAKMTFISITAHGPGSDGSEDVAGYSRNIKLYTATSSNFIFGNEAFYVTGDAWQQIVSGDFTAAGPNGSGTDVPKIIKSENISSKLKKGLNLFKIESVYTSSEDIGTASQYTGAGLAVLDVIGYSKG